MSVLFVLAVAAEFAAVGRLQARFASRLAVGHFHRHKFAR